MLSFFRIFLIPFIVWTYLIKLPYIAAGLLALSGITDIADGFIARKFNMISTLGKALDPIADKLTCLAALVSLCFVSKIMIALAAVTAVREIVMAIQGCVVLKKTGTTYSARWYGKVATALLYLTILVNFVWTDMPFALSLSLVVILSLFVFGSMISYVVDNTEMLKTYEKEKKLIKQSIAKSSEIEQFS